MDILAFLGAVPKIALFLLLIVGGAIVAEIAYFTKKKWPTNSADLLSQEPVTQQLKESTATMPPPPALTVEEVIPPKTPRINKKIITAALIFLTLAITIPTTVFLVKQRQEIRKEAAICSVCSNDNCCDIGPCTGNTSCVGNIVDGCACECVPDCSGEANICLGVTYPDGCGGTCTGTKVGGGCPEPTSQPTAIPTPIPTPTPLAGCVNFDTVATGDGVSATWTGGSGSAGVSWTRCDCLGVQDFCGTGCNTVKSVTFSGPTEASDQYTFFPQDCSTAQIDATTTNGCTGSEHGIVVQNDNNCTSPTPGGTPVASCQLIRIYDDQMNLISDFSTLTIGQQVYIYTRGTTTDAAGITKARFRINSNATTSWCTGNGLTLTSDWCETTLSTASDFYIPYTISTSGSYTIESMVYNPTLGWY